MKDNEINDEELEEEFEKAFNKNISKKSVFEILRAEKSAQDLKDKREKRLKF